MTRLLVLLALVAALMPGCAVLGRQQKDSHIQPETVSQVKKGMSKEEVTALLGAPQEIIFSNREHDPLREHAYIFTHTTTLYTGIFLALISFGNADEKSDRVVVFFDADGKVEHVGATLAADSADHGFPFGR